MDQTQLRQLEARCIQEEPPWCAAACPLHVDARALCGHVAEGAMGLAWAVLKRHMPLPGVLGRICHQPCRAACLRGRVGDPVRVGDLERAVVATPEPGARVLPMPKRPGRVLVAGAGLAGLTAAFDLAKKGLSVTVATGRDRPGGSLLDLPRDLLPPQALESEIQRLAAMGVGFRLSSPLDWDPADGPPQGFEAACLDLDDPCPGQGPGPLVTDPLTLEAAQNVFVCAKPEDADALPAVDLAALGRRAARSVDRRLQGVSLTAGRDREGPFETRLYTNIQGLEPLAETPMADPAQGYSPGEAQAEAGRCLDCNCLECVKACPYLERFKAYPRVYARQIYNNEAIVKGLHTANILINSCMLCGLCSAVCPEGFPMAETCLAARQSLVERGKMPPSAHEFALQDMAFSNGEHFFLARPGPEPGAQGQDLLFFPGCQLCGSSPGHVEAAYQGLLASFGRGVGLLLGCCGAPGHWAGRPDLFRAALDQVRGPWRAMGQPRLVVACSSCLQMFGLGLPEAEATSLWELYAEHGLPRGERAPAPGPLAVHDPCTTRHKALVRQSARRVLTELGADLVELPYGNEQTRCCGFGGLLVSANPALADEVAAQRIVEHGRDYVTYCAMCRDRLARGGKRILHLLDLVFPGPAKADPAARPDPGFSMRRDNRARLRTRLLEAVWGEQDPAAQRHEALVLDMSPDTAALLEERRILVQDVRAAIGQAEATGQKFADPTTGRFLARRRPVNVTFWVEYSPAGHGFLVHNAWCHRMAVKGTDP